jgi:hypothetical protein
MCDDFPNYVSIEQNKKRGKTAKSEATVSSDGEMSGNEGGKKKRKKKHAAADGEEKKPRGGLKKEYTLRFTPLCLSARACQVDMPFLLANR